MTRRFNPNEPRDPFGRWTGILDALRAPDAGFTIHPHTGASPTSGFQVGVSGRTLKVNGQIPTLDQLSAMSEGELTDHFDQWLEQNADAFDNQNMHIGAWHEPGTQRIHFDLSEHVADRATAVRLGRQRNQVAIWDNANTEPINTGGTGD